MKKTFCEKDFMNIFASSRAEKTFILKEIIANLKI